MRKPLLLLVTAAAVATTPHVASADQAQEQNLVRISTNGSCPSGFRSVVNVDDTHVCVRNVTLDPDVYVTSYGCAAGYTEVGSAAVGRWVCVSI